MLTTNRTQNFICTLSTTFLLLLLIMLLLLIVLFIQYDLIEQAPRKMSNVKSSKNNQNQNLIFSTKVSNSDLHHHLELVQIRFVFYQVLVLKRNNKMVIILTCGSIILFKFVPSNATVELLYMTQKFRPPPTTSAQVVSLQADSFL
jgi:hypothetical protein